MLHSEKVLAVLAEAREMSSVFDAWPSDMSLAICLFADGDCRLIVFREEEQRSVLARLSRHFEIEPSDMCVVPKADGYPTRVLHYSDQQRLMALVAEQQDIVDEAADYSVNFTFALEEGLNPEVLLGAVETGAVEDPGEEDHEDAGLEDEQIVLSFKSSLASKIKEAPEEGAKLATLPSFLRRPKPSLPGPGFRSLIEIEAEDAAFETFQLYKSQGGWIEVSKPGADGSELRVVSPEKIYLRDDGKVVALAREKNTLRFQVPPTRFLIDAGILPERLRKLFEQGVGAVQVRKTADFVYLRIEARADERPVAKPKLEDIKIEVDPKLLQPEKPEIVEQVEVPVAAPAKTVKSSKKGALLATTVAILFGLFGLGIGMLTGLERAAETQSEQPVGKEPFQLSKFFPRAE
ncbi:hypothetical protein [Shimia sp. CNT1-13L.2]|uniref:hypothetical protein n=1 Tax=Shimia sp. CNT1-13L.2 TaxID=2959663 RepID=UPI0020CE1B2A|nr:hypothetical protein [Shimia sp. CNT1-13L.2]